MIIGTGIDLVDSRRIQELYTKYGEKFISRILSEDEKRKFKTLSDENNKKIMYLAKRFAGKEALSKALGTGIGDLSFNKIKILNNHLGKPIVKIDSNKNILDLITNIKFNFLDSLKIKFGINRIKIDISLSDEYPMAVAFVVVSM